MGTSVRIIHSPPEQAYQAYQTSHDLDSCFSGVDKGSEFICFVCEIIHSHTTSTR